MCAATPCGKCFVAIIGALLFCVVAPLALAVGDGDASIDTASDGAAQNVAVRVSQGDDRDSGVVLEESSADAVQSGSEEGDSVADGDVVDAVPSVQQAKQDGDTAQYAEYSVSDAQDTGNVANREDGDAVAQELVQDAVQEGGEQSPMRDSTGGDAQGGSAADNAQEQDVQDGSDDVRDGSNEESGNSEEDGEVQSCTALRLAFISIGDVQSARNDIIAVRNTSQAPLDLARYALRKVYYGRGGDVRDASIVAFRAGDVLAANAIGYWMRRGARFDVPLLRTTTASVARNQAVVLLCDGVVSDAIAWGDAPRTFMAHEIVARVQNPSPAQYIVHMASGAALSRQCESDILRTAPCPRDYDASQKVVINEVLPNPIGSDADGEFIELYNATEYPIDMRGWVLADARTQYTLSGVIAPRSYRSIARSASGIVLNNAREQIVLYAPRGDGLTVVDQLTLPATSAREGVAYGRVDGGAAWLRVPTPGAENIPNALPHIVRVDVPQRIYRGVRTPMQILAEDRDGDALAYAWDFGDGHKSYRAKTSHTYEGDGVYTVTVRVRDGFGSVSAKRRVHIERYPRFAVKIRAIAPNPPGRDRESEFILIKNTDKRKVDLRQWKIGTGRDRKSIVRHGIKSRIILRPGEEYRITSRDAAITLPNAGGVVTLYRPDGSIAYERAYVPPQGMQSVPDGAVYRKRTKNDGGWWWDMRQVSTHSSARSAAKQSQVLRSDVVAEIVTRAWRNTFAQSPRVAGARSAPAPMSAGPARREGVFMQWLHRVARTVIVTLPTRAQEVASREVVPPTGRLARFPSGATDPAALHWCLLTVENCVENL